MAVLYLTEQGAVLRKKSKTLVVDKAGEVLLEVPEFKVERVLIFGNIQITTQAVAFLLESGIETSFFTMNGKLKGKLTPLETKNVYLRLYQYKRYQNEDFKLRHAQRIIEGKIKNQIVLLQRYQRNHPEVDFTLSIDRLQEAINTLQIKKKVSTVLGVEGAATAVYFETFGKMFRKELKFDGRSRRPPKDPVNALLSFGYTLITNEILSLLSGMGFDPYIGYLHAIDYGRPSLALDLVEEFRHPIVDRLVLSSFNKEVFDAEDFEEKEDGVFLKENSRKTFFLHYERSLQQHFQYEDSEVNFRQLFKKQAQKLAQVILKNEQYSPFLLK
jgi:CRISPR-associated protein Cas1